MTSGTLETEKGGGGGVGFLLVLFFGVVNLVADDWLIRRKCPFFELAMGVEELGILTQMGLQ